MQYPYIRSGENKAYIKAWSERDYTSLEIPTGYYDNINNVVYSLEQLILTTSKFQKNNLDICYASVDKRTFVYIKTAVTYNSKMMLPQILVFEPGTTINNSLLTSPYLSLTTENVSSLYFYTDIIHS